MVISGSDSVGHEASGREDRGAGVGPATAGGGVRVRALFGSVDHRGFDDSAFDICDGSASNWSSIGIGAS